MTESGSLGLVNGDYIGTRMNNPSGSCCKPYRSLFQPSNEIGLNLISSKLGLLLGHVGTGREASGPDNGYVPDRTGMPLPCELRSEPMAMR